MRSVHLGIVRENTVSPEKEIGASATLMKIEIYCLSGYNATKHNFSCILLLLTFTWRLKLFLSLSFFARDENAKGSPALVLE